MNGLKIKENLYNIYSLYRGVIQEMLTIMYKFFIWLLLSRGEGVRIPPGLSKK